MTVAFVPTPDDPYGLGTDIALQGDLNPVWGLVSGFTNLGYALARRLRAELGSLFDDLGYGSDVTDLINQALQPTDVTRISQAIANQCLLDERVQTCRVSLVLTRSTKTLTITITGTIPTGVPFTFVMAATSVTVALLAVNGAQVQQPTPTAVTAPSGGTTVIIQGGSSEPGPPGPPGPGGSPQLTFNLNPNGYAPTTIGDNEVVDQIDANLAGLNGTITIELVAAVLSASGTATFRLYLGGSDGATDGTVVATLTASTSSFVTKNNSTTIANPGGLQRLKLAIDTTVSGADAQIDRGATITIR